MSVVLRSSSVFYKWQIAHPTVSSSAARAAEGILAEQFPRRDEFARLLDEMTQQRQEMNQQFKQVDQRFEQVDQRFEQVEQEWDKRWTCGWNGLINGLHVCTSGLMG
jgi:adenylate kinase family enzyme